MTKQDAGRIIYALKASYPTVYVNIGPGEFSKMADVWAALFTEYDVRLVMAGLQAFIMADTKGFPPSPGQIVDIIHKTADSGDRLTAAEAWTLVRRAVSDGYYHADEEFARLPDAVKRAVGSPGNIRELAMCEQSELETIEKSHFIRAYNTEIQREQERAKIPEKVRRTISEGMALISDGEAKGITDKKGATR